MNHKQHLVRYQTGQGMARTSRLTVYVANSILWIESTAPFPFATCQDLPGPYITELTDENGNHIKATTNIGDASISIRLWCNTTPGIEYIGFISPTN